MKALRIMAMLFTRVTALLIMMGLTAVAAGLYYFVTQVDAAEVPDTIMASDSASPVTVLDRNGDEIAKLQPEGGVIKVVKYDEISPNMINAMISAEDGNYWHNLGFEPRRIAAAAIGQVQGNPGAGGGSTLTQQYVKNQLVGDEISLERKWKEILSATKMTSVRTKEQIITDYLNSVYFGRGAIGIENAAELYFGVRASELSVEQSALIAGVVQSPSTHDPAVDRKSAVERFNYVIDQMERWGHITGQEASSALFPDTISPGSGEKTTGMEDGATGMAVRMALSELESRGIPQQLLFDRGATITLTIDPDIHSKVQEHSIYAEDTHGIRVGSATVDPDNGEILGFYGGRDGYGFNTATSLQMTGSTFKVFTLASAVANEISTDTVVSSAPYDAPGGVTINNSDGMTCGECSISQATRLSLNTSYHRIQDMLPEGADSTRKMAHEMGVSAPLAEEDGSVTDSIVLGTYGSSPLDMASGYATIASGGIHRDSHIVSNVTSRFGSTVYESDTKDKRVLTTPQANAINEVLAPIADMSNNHGLEGRQGYMKTGTVQYGEGSATGANRDGWAVGYSTDSPHSTAVWVGSDEGGPVYDAYGQAIWGATVPSDIWKSIMDDIR